MLTIKPKTRKEIYMAYLSGDMSLELPEPLTRDEVNLYNLCKNRAYGEYTTVKEVLAECQPEFVADEGVFALTNDLILNDGETYTVVWNGVEYKSVAHDLSASLGVTAFALGELSALDGPAGNGEPFGIAYMPSDYGAFGWTGVIIPLDGSTTLTISIRQEVATIHPIDQKFIVLVSPNGTKYNLTVADDGTLSAVAAT